MDQALVDLESFRLKKVDEERNIRRFLIKLKELKCDLQSISHLPEIREFVAEKTTLERLLRQKL